MNEMICATCYAVGQPRTKGTGPLTLLLFLGMTVVALFLFWPVGLFFLVLLIIDMARGQKRVCRACGAAGLIPADSPRGRQMLGGG